MSTFSFLRSTSILFASACLAICGTVHAQPQPFGCHFFHGQTAPMRPMNIADRAEIDETIARSDTFDILHYEITLDVTDYLGQNIKGAAIVTYKALVADRTSIRFDLLDLTVDSITSDEGPLLFDHDGQFLDVSFLTSPPVGEERSMTVHYHGSPHRDPEWGGFYFESNYIYNLGIGISSIPPNFGKVWYPCFDSFVERATYTYHVKSAGTYRLQGQGIFLGEVQLGGDTVVRSYALDQRIPTHLSAIAVADYQVHAYTHSGANGDIPVTLVSKPANLSNMLARFEQLGAAIDACEHWYGPYPFDRVGYVLTTDGALEIPTNVAYPQFMTTQSVASNRALYTHELGHHWWGDMVTPYIHNDMWLKEGPAEYSGHLIEEWLSGHPGLVNAVNDNMLYVLRSAHVNDDGFQALSPMPDEHIYGTHTYYKGAAVMHNLRGYLGDELFRQAMLYIQENRAYTTITAEGFKDVLEEATGTDLDPFFDAWVFEPGYAVFEVRSMTAAPNGATWEVDLTIGQKLRGTDQFHDQVPLDVTFLSVTGDAYDTTVTVGGALTEVMLTAPFEPDMVMLNRHTRLNQARLAHESTIIPGASFDEILPFVDMRLYDDLIVDTTFVRIEHIWAAPDQSPIGPDITALSDSHYWVVDGQWPEGTVLRGRMSYSGSQPTQLDNALIAGNEAGICLVYRAQIGDPWQVCEGQVVTAGSLTNGTGFIVVNNLRKGQYAFAKATAIVGLDDAEPVTDGLTDLYPVPASDHVFVSGHLDGRGTLVFDIHAMDGRIVQRSASPAAGGFQEQLDISKLATGSYVLHVMTTDGRIVGNRRFEVVH